MAHKPRIRFTLTEDRNDYVCNVNGVSVQHQLTLADFGGERNFKFIWNVFFSEIDMEASCELCLNIEAASILADKLTAFLNANVTPQREDYA